MIRNLLLSVDLGLAHCLLDLTFTLSLELHLKLCFVLFKHGDLGLRVPQIENQAFVLLLAAAQLLFQIDDSDAILFDFLHIELFEFWYNSDSKSYFVS